MFLKVDRIGIGLHASEIIAAVRTRVGVERFIVNKDAIDASDRVDVGEPVGRRGEEFLIELPAETTSGTWRVWVPKSALTGEALEAAE